eukprot:6354043-Amphidinium_carterae.1
MFDRAVKSYRTAKEQTISRLWIETPSGQQKNKQNNRRAEIENLEGETIRVGAEGATSNNPFARPVADLSRESEAKKRAPRMDDASDNQGTKTLARIVRVPSGTQRCTKK